MIKYYCLGCEDAYMGHGKDRYVKLEGIIAREYEGAYCRKCDRPMVPLPSSEKHLKRTRDTEK